MAAFDPTVGIVMGELKELVGELSTLAETLGGEVKAATQQAQASASQLLAEMDHRLGRRQDLLVSQLKDQELRLVEDAMATIDHGRRAAELIRTGVLEGARESLHETDILAYGAMRDLKCEEKAPRLVYAKPFQFRVWPRSNLVVDPEAGDPQAPPNPPERRQAFVQVRGNYLAFAAPQVTVRVGSGPSHPATIVGSNHGGFTAVVDGEAIQDLENIAQPTPLEVAGRLTGCKGDVRTQAVTVNVLPAITYQVAATISPRADMPTYARAVKAYSQMGSDRCDDRKDVTQTFSVGPPGEVVDWKLNVRSLGGKSHINSVDKAGDYSVRVQAILAGKGRDCFAGFCNCKGRGWIDYGLTIDYATWAPTDLLASTLTSNVTKTDYAFRYLHPVPAGARQLTCNYYVRVTLSEGQTRFEHELSHANPNSTTPHGPITTRADAQCNLFVSVPPAMVAALNSGALR